jgi:RNA polymerase sigma factor (sigma-70 family)
MVITPEAPAREVTVDSHTGPSGDAGGDPELGGAGAAPDEGARAAAASSESAETEPGDAREMAEFSDGGANWDPPAWDEVVRAHSGRVYRLAYRLTGNRPDAEDLTQEVFVRVFRALDRYRPGTFEGWLHRITTNLFLDGARRRARIRFEALPEDAERVPGRERSPEQVYVDENLDDDVQRALAALPPDFRAAVVLCDIEGLSYEEIAATLGVKLGTVRSRIHRGRSQLRETLAHRAPRDYPFPGATESSVDGMS